MNELVEDISGYTLKKILVEEGDWRWYEATKGEARCCIKLYSGENYPEAAALLNHESYILSLLNDSRIVRAIDHQIQKDHPYLLLEELLGISLEQFTSGRLFPIETVLSIVSQLCNIVALLHASGIQHGELSPRLFFIDPDTEKLQLIALNHATRIDQQQARILGRNLSNNIISYLAPEQTGYTINSFVDYKADIFACGVILYEMLLGQRPWSSSTSLEYIQLLISTEPLSPREIDPAIPQAVSDIVMLCLKKEPEKRYSSAAQLSKDLRDCQEQLHNHGIIFDTSFIEKDSHEELLKPSFLIGRSEEESFLYNSYQKVAQGRACCLLLIGETGAGKTALARSLLRPTALSGGYFLTAQFGPQQLHIPYLALNQALTELVYQILNEEPAKQELLKVKIFEALEGHGAVLTELFPTLEKLIGPQPKMRFLHSQESQTRQIILFKRLISAIATDQAPLILFLDDLQWSDPASMRLIKALIVDPLIEHVLVLGTCREEMLTTDHLNAILTEIKEENGVVIELPVKNLPKDDVATLIQTILPYSLAKIKIHAIADLLHAKSGGNLFYLLTLIQQLYEDGHLATKSTFEQIQLSCVGWTLDSLLMKKMDRIPTAARTLLALGAEIDNVIDLYLMSLATKISLPAILRALWPAALAGIITPCNNNYYQIEGSDEAADLPPFPRDNRITFSFTQNAFYNLAYNAVAETEKAKIHYTIGTAELKQASQEYLSLNIFEVVFHFNKALKLVNSGAEQLELAALNLEACRKAQAYVAHKTAYECITVARMLLPNESWSSNYDLTYAIYLESTTCAYLMKHFEQIEELSSIILSYARSILDKGRLYVVKINFYTNISQNQAALEQGAICLKLFGICLSSHPSKITLFCWLTRVRWLMRGKKISELAALPPMENEEHLFVMEALMALIAAAFIVDKELTSLIVLRMMEYTLRYGSCHQSFFAFSAYAGVIEIIFRDYPTAYEFAQLSLYMAEQTHDSAALSRANYTMAVIVNHWTHPLPSSRLYMDRCYFYGVTSGELVLLSFICMFYGFLDGEFFYNLDKAYHSVLAHKGLVLACKNKLALESFYVREGVINALTSPHFDGKDLNVVGFDEKDFLKRLQPDPELISAVQAYVAYKMIVLAVFGNYAEALDLFHATQTSRRAAIALITERLLNFYHSLALAALYDQAGFFEKISYRIQIFKNQRLMKWWTDCCPANNLHRYQLIEAERARIKGDRRRAAKLYDSAAIQAHKENQLMEEAIIQERAALFHASLGHKVAAKGYLFEAYRLYGVWGAISKLNMMTKNHTELNVENRKTREANAPSEMTLNKPNGFSPMAVDTAAVAASLDLYYQKKLPTILPSKLIEIIAADAGAGAIAFLVKRNGAWHIYQEKDPTEPLDGPIEENKATEKLLSDNPELFLPALYFSIRTGEQLLINETSLHPLTASLPSNSKIKSLLVLPIVENKNFHSVLYLENHLLPGAFSEKIIPSLQLLGLQLATAITNTSLHNQLTEVSGNLEVINKRLKDYSEELEKKIARRTGELEDKNRELQKSMYQLETMQKQVLQREKLAGMGSLAQGFAHEIKNPLNFINNFASLSREMLNDLEIEVESPTAKSNIKQLKQIMVEVVDEGQKADNIIVNMLRFSAPGSEQASNIDINELLKNYVSIIKMKFSQRYPNLSIEIHEHYSADLPHFTGLMRRLGQAIGIILDYSNNTLVANWEKEKNKNKSFIPQLFISTSLVNNAIILVIKINSIEVGKAEEPAAKTESFPLGIGLSMAKDIIVMEEGGKISFKSEGGYQEFFISLPLLA